MSIEMKALLLAAALSSHFDSRDCVSLVVFSEARSESYLGQALVAQVVVNRAVASGDGLCEVVTAQSQFHGVERWAYPRDPVSIDKASWERAQRVTADVVSGDYVSAPRACAEATYFFKRPIPAFAKNFTFLCEVGAHVFMKESQ